MSIDFPRAKVGPDHATTQNAHSRWAWCLLLLVCLSGGCRGFTNVVINNEAYDEFVLGWRDYTWARRAWTARKRQFRDQAALYDFRAGFIDGYIGVASGGNGCTPSIPPQKYWTWKYQSAEGQTKIAAWFAGYPHGARAAEEEGAGNFLAIPVAQEFVERYQRQDPRHPLNQAFYDNLPTPQVAPQPYAPAPQGGPMTSPWVEPLGSGMPPAPQAMPDAATPYSPAPGETPLPNPPTGDERPQSLPQTLPPIPPDENDMGGLGYPDRLPIVVDTEEHPVQFPAGVIPMAEPAGWTPDQGGPVAEGPSPAIPDQADFRPMPLSQASPNVGLSRETNAFPSMLELLQAMPAFARQAAATQGETPSEPPSAPVAPASYEENNAAKPEQPVVGDQLQAPATPPAMLQQPLGAPLFQSPGR